MSIAGGGGSKRIMGFGCLDIYVMYVYMYMFIYMAGVLARGHPCLDFVLDSQALLMALG